MLLNVHDLFIFRKLCPFPNNTRPWVYKQIQTLNHLLYKIGISNPGRQKLAFSLLQWFDLIPHHLHSSFHSLPLLTYSWSFNNKKQLTSFVRESLTWIYFNKFIIGKKKEGWAFFHLTKKGKCPSLKVFKIRLKIGPN